MNVDYIKNFIKIMALFIVMSCEGLALVSSAESKNKLYGSNSIDDHEHLDFSDLKFIQNQPPKLIGKFLNENNSNLDLEYKVCEDLDETRDSSILDPKSSYINTIKISENKDDRSMFMPKYPKDKINLTKKRVQVSKKEEKNNLINNFITSSTLPSILVDASDKTIDHGSSAGESEIIFVDENLDDQDFCLVTTPNETASESESNDSQADKINGAKNKDSDLALYENSPFFTEDMQIFEENPLFNEGVASLDENNLDDKDEVNPKNNNEENLENNNANETSNLENLNHVDDSIAIEPVIEEDFFSEEDNERVRIDLDESEIEPNIIGKNEFFGDIIHILEEEESSGILPGLMNNEENGRNYYYDEEEEMLLSSDDDSSYVELDELEQEVSKEVVESESLANEDLLNKTFSEKRVDLPMLNIQSGNHSSKKLNSDRVFFKPKKIISDLEKSRNSLSSKISNSIRSDKKSGDIYRRMHQKNYDKCNRVINQLKSAKVPEKNILEVEKILCECNEEDFASTIKNILIKYGVSSKKSKNESFQTPKKERNQVVMNRSTV